MAAVDRTQQIGPLAGGAAPFSYTVPSSFTFGLLAIRAVFDGTAAGGDFVPTVQIVSDSGQLMAQVKGDTVTAGGSADATFAPFLGQGEDATGYTTIQDEGVAVTRRHTLDFIGSAVTVTDDAANARTKVTIGGGAFGDVGCRIYNTSAETIADNTFAPLTFDTAQYDTDSMFNAGTHPTRITVNTAGKYQVGGNISWAANAAGFRDLRILVNSAFYIALSRVAPVGGGFQTIMNASAVWSFSAGDYIELPVVQTSGGNLDVQAINHYSPEFWAQKFVG